MQLVREKMTIPVPEVHNWTDRSMSMDFVEGVQLKKTGCTLAKEERASIGGHPAILRFTCPDLWASQI